MIKSLYSKSIAKIAFSPLIDKDKGYKKIYTFRERFGSRNFQAQSARGPMLYIIIK